MSYGKFIILIACLSPFMSGCPGPIHYDPFSVRVVDETGAPIQDVVVISAVSIWMPPGPVGGTESNRTDANGWVELDGYGKNKSGYFRLTNYFPLDTILRPESIYVLKKTPYISTTRNALEGDNYYFHGDYIITMTKKGFYRCYPFNEARVSIPTSVQLPIQYAISSVYFDENHLYIENNNDQIYQFDIENPLAPIAGDTIQLPVSGYVKTINQSVWIFGGITYNRIHVYEEVDGSLLSRSIIPTEGSAQIYLKNRRMLMLNDDGWWGYDLTDLAHPVLVNPNKTNNNEYAIFLDSLMIKYIGSDDENDSSHYQIYRLDDPCFPTLLEQVIVPGRISTLSSLHQGYLSRSSNVYYYGNEAHFAVRQLNSEVFDYTGYSLASVECSRGFYYIGSDSLRCWEPRLSTE